MLKEHPYTAVQVLTILRDQGFNGGITIVKDYIQQILAARPGTLSDVVVRAGRCAQVDRGSWEMIAVGNNFRRC